MRSEAGSRPKYEKPLVLLVDCEEEVRERLERLGFQVNCGSFGSSHAVSKNQELTLDGELPKIADTDLIIVGLNGFGQEGDSPIESYRIPGGERTALFGTGSTVNSAPYYAYTNTAHIKRVLEHGGGVIVFG